MTTLEFFDQYVKCGLQIIPLYPNSKIPIWKKWNEGWELEKARNYLLSHPSCNIGLLLGKVVDVEGDTPEAELMLQDLIGSYDHPCWRSIKSTHHLFINPDPRLTNTRFLGMEFRAYKHQSVLPPSIHSTGIQYEWQRICPIPAMPEPLLDFYRKNRPKYPLSSRRKPRRLLPEGHVLTQCNKCHGREKIHKKRLVLEVRAFAELGLKWQCHDCRKMDVRPACRRIRTELRRVLPVFPIPKVRRKEDGGFGDILVG